MDFCDRSDLIFISYHGGSAGFAVKVLLSFSPETNARLITPYVRPDGAAHSMVLRYDMCRDGSVINGVYHIHRAIDPGAEWFDSVHCIAPDQDLIRGIRDYFNASSGLDGEPLHSVKGTMIMADHIPPRFARMVFPNAKVIRVNRDLLSSHRAYFIKNLMQLSVDDTGRFDASSDLQRSIDSILDEQGLIRTYANYKKVLRQIHTGRGIERQSIVDDITSGIIDMDYDDLFLPSSDWQKTYRGLVESCGLTPQMDAAGVFIHAFIEKQWDRRVHDIDERWHLLRRQ